MNAIRSRFLRCIYNKVKLLSLLVLTILNVVNYALNNKVL